MKGRGRDLGTSGAALTLAAMRRLHTFHHPFRPSSSPPPLQFDASLSCDGQDAAATAAYVADLVTRQVGGDGDSGGGGGIVGFELQPHQVVLVSARNALLARLVMGGQASPEVVARFARLAFGRFADPATLSQVCVRGGVGGRGCRGLGLGLG